MSRFNPRILIVDDNPAIHEDFRKIFSPIGNSNGKLEAAEAVLFGESGVQKPTFKFELEYASQGKEALTLVCRAANEGRPFAVAFMDMRMPPGWDGVETTAKIWEVDPHLQVVFCTAFSDYSWENVTTQLGGNPDGFVILKKPFETVEVLQLATAFSSKWNAFKETQTAQKTLRQSRTDLEKRVNLRTEELSQARSRIEHLLSCSPTVLYSTQLLNQSKTAFISDNVVSALGFNAADFIGDSQFWINRLHPEDSDRVRTERAKLVEGNRCSIEYRFRHKDGSYRWIHDDSRVIRSGDAPAEVIGTLSDVTDLKNAERDRQMIEVQLRQAQKLEAIGQLAAGIAHEINTPTQYVGDNTRFLKESFENITKILQKYEELLRAAKTNSITAEMISRTEELIASSDLTYLFEQVPAAIRETLEGVERVTRIVRAMKEFSHPGSKEKAPADLNKAIESTVTVAHNEWKYVANMQLNLDPQLPSVPCFLGEFNQVVLNLVINACHAIADVVKEKSGTKGTITISTRRDGDHVEVRVNDTGTGIAEANRARIFEPFFTTKDVGKGTGQGLSLVYSSVVKKHGGTVTFETEVGKGTTFIIRLPLV